jgi:DNA-binding transcriptional ArsR family regulator
VFDERANEKPARNNLPPRADRLAELLGRGRASVLRALVVPTTTTVVARAVGLAPSTVSQHLSALHLAGVVRKRRSGSRVLYELDHGGFILLNQVDGARQ